MNLKDARKLQPGAIVRESYRPEDFGESVHGLVIGKKYVKERHHAKVLSQVKDERYDVVVHWMCTEVLVPREYKKPVTRLQVRENWELMVVSHASS